MLCLPHLIAKLKLNPSVIFCRCFVHRYSRGGRHSARELLKFKQTKEPHKTSNIILIRPFVCHSVPVHPLTGKFSLFHTFTQITTANPFWWFCRRPRPPPRPALCLCTTHPPTPLGQFDSRLINLIEILIDYEMLGSSGTYEGINSHAPSLIATTPHPCELLNASALLLLLLPWGMDECHPLLSSISVPIVFSSPVVVVSDICPTCQLNDTGPQWINYHSMHSVRLDNFMIKECGARD